MRCLILGALFLVAVPAVVAQDAKDKPKPDTPVSTAEKELKDLEADFNKSLAELFKPLKDVKTPEEAQKIFEQEKLAEKQEKLGADFAKRAFAIIDNHPKENEVVADALIWIVNNAQGSASATQAVDLLIRDHLANKKIDALLPSLAGMPLDAHEKLFRAVVDKADAERKTRLRLQLAKFLKNKADAIGTIKSLDEKTLRTVEQRVGKDALARLTASDPAKASAEAETLFDALVKDKSISASIRESAEAELFEMLFLAIGKQALDIEGEDTDGKKFKLSDYRGKVVVLDFWGNW